jgi:hypothetical protein
LFGASSEKYIRSTITAGSVYYYYEAALNSPKQHNFVVINADPAKDKIIFLLCCSSQIENVRNLRADCPAKTLIEILQYQYSRFTADTIIDCNYVFEHTVSEIARLFAKRKLEERPVMDIRLVQQMRAGVILSPMVDKQIKKLLEGR